MLAFAVISPPDVMLLFAVMLPIVKLPVATIFVTVLPPSVPTFNNATTLALPYAEVGLTFTPPPLYSVVKLFDDTFAIFFYLI